MSEELQNHLNSFITYIISKIDKKEIQNIQKEYDAFIEILNKTIEDNEELNKIISDYESKIKSYNAQKEIDADKIKSMMAELANNMDLNEKYKKLKEDYDKLNQKFNFYKNENAEFQMKLKNNEKLINELQEEISNVKKENFEKFEKITELEKDFKLNEIKLSQANDKINKFTIENNDLTKENTELRNNYLDQQKNYQNKLLVLERQIKQLSESNNNFAEENNQVQTELKELQNYTGIIKAKTPRIEEKDFAILEVMSLRAERAELEVQKLLTYTEELKALNEKLRNKIKPLEDYALLQIKHDHEINTGIDTIYDLKNKVLTDDERAEIDKLKNEPNELLQSLIKLKTENLELHNQLKDITIEANQQLREAKRKY